MQECHSVERVAEECRQPSRRRQKWEEQELKHVEVEPYWKKGPNCHLNCAKMSVFRSGAETPYPDFPVTHIEAEPKLQFFPRSSSPVLHAARNLHVE